MREAARELKQLQTQFLGSVDLLQRGRKLIKVGWQIHVACAAFSCRDARDRGSLMLAAAPWYPITLRACGFLCVPWRREHFFNCCAARPQPPCAFLQEGALYKVCRRTDKSFYFHLFNDCLLYSETTVLGYRLHRSFELQNCVTEDIDEDMRCSHEFHGAPPHSFIILTDHKSFIAYTDTDAEKMSWLSALNQAIVLARAVTGTRFVLTAVWVGP